MSRGEHLRLHRHHRSEPHIPTSIARPDHLRASLPQSIAATTLMIAVPVIVIWLSSQVLYFKLSTGTALALSIALSLVCSLMLARVWERRSKTAEISFSELMIWSWYRLQKAERRLEKGLLAAETTRSHDEQLQVLHELTAALESKDPYTRGHSRRVERHSFKTGVAMGLAIDDVEVLRMSASLHDVGKIRVPNRVLHKPGALSDEERDLIEEHPALGAEMVASIGDERVVETVRHHHERWDGRGYPDRIAGTEIPLFSRVIAVADSYDAIRSTRSYRTGASRDQAVTILTEESGRQFDPEVVEAFLTTLPARGRAVAWLTSLTTGPGVLWRYLEQLFQRFGSTALAPVIGAAGAAVVIGSSSILSPAIPARGYAAVTPAAATASPGATAVPFEGASDMRGPDRAIAEQKEDRKTKAATGGGKTSEPQGSSKQGSEPAPDSPVASDTGGEGTAVTGDPREEDGKDCKEGTRKRSKGSTRHCE